MTLSQEVRSNGIFYFWKMERCEKRKEISGSYFPLVLGAEKKITFGCAAEEPWTGSQLCGKYRESLSCSLHSNLNGKHRLNSVSKTNDPILCDVEYHKLPWGCGSCSIEAR